MGTWLDWRSCSESGSEVPHDAASRLAFDSIRETEILYSTWRDDSELSRLNRRPELSDSSPLRGELEHVLKITRKLNGAFHPGLGHWIRASGVREGRFSNEALERFQRTHRIPAKPSDRYWLWEEGGFAKGLALDRAARAMEIAGVAPIRWEMNFGGQIVNRGTRAREVAIAQSQNRNQAAVHFRISAESVSTSGQSENPGHILDPRTGLVALDRGSATAIHSSALVADMVSTALLVLGPEDAAQWWRAREHDSEFQGLDWVWVERTGKITASCGMKVRGFEATSATSIVWVGDCLTP